MPGELSSACLLNPRVLQWVRAKDLVLERLEQIASSASSLFVYVPNMYVRQAKGWSCCFIIVCDIMCLTS